MCNCIGDSTMLQLKFWLRLCMLHNHNLLHIYILIYTVTYVTWTNHCLAHSYTVSWPHAGIEQHFWLMNLSTDGWPSNVFSSWKCMESSAPILCWLMQKQHIQAYLGIAANAAKESIGCIRRWCGNNLQPAAIRLRSFGICAVVLAVLQQSVRDVSHPLHRLIATLLAACRSLSPMHQDDSETWSAAVSVGSPWHVAATWLPHVASVSLHLPPSFL